MDESLDAEVEGEIILKSISQHLEACGKAGRQADHQWRSLELLMGEQGAVQFGAAHLSVT